MPETTHTTGEWSAGTDEDAHIIYADIPGQPCVAVAETLNDDGEMDEAEERANARLISAGPNFMDAVTGDIEPNLWNVNYAESVLMALADGSYETAMAEDPQAWDAAVRQALSMCRWLRVAVSKAKGRK